MAHLTTHSTGLAISSIVVIEVDSPPVNTGVRCLPMMRVLSIIAVTVCCIITSLAQEGDILDFAAKHPRGEMITNPDGTYRIPKFGDHRLELTVEALKDYPRPWTVTKVLAWYEEAEDGKIRAHLLWVLAASRDSRAALALGNALDDDSLDVRMATTYGLLGYFMRIGVSGGTEQHMLAVKEWWEKNRERIQQEAERLRLKATPNNSLNRSANNSCFHPITWMLVSVSPRPVNFGVRLLVEPY